MSFQSSKSITTKPDILKCFVNHGSSPPPCPPHPGQEALLSARDKVGLGQFSTWRSLSVLQTFSDGQAVSLSNCVLSVLKLLLRSACQTTRHLSGRVMGLSPCSGHPRASRGWWDATFWSEFLSLTLVCVCMLMSPLRNSHPVHRLNHHRTLLFLQSNIGG